MAPEVLKEEEHAFSADMWSLGAVTSFVCNGGKHLFRSNYDITQSEVMIDRLSDHFSLGLRKMIVKLLCVNSKERPIAFEIQKKAEEMLFEMRVEDFLKKSLVIGAATLFAFILFGRDEN